MNTPIDLKTITLDTLTQQKRVTRKAILAQEQQLKARTNSILNPIKDLISGSKLIQKSISTGSMVFEGVKMGLKLISQVRRLFS